MKSRARTIAVAAALAAALAAPALAAAPATAAGPGWTPLAEGPRPEANPLKGFIPFAGEHNTFPHSMEWAYFPLDAVVTGPGTYDWTAFDAQLDDIAARGHQTALRFYLDYPTRESGIPQYLLDGGLETHAYDDFGNAGVSVSPDYDDPALREAVDGFVAALGARYDGDPRVGYVQAGLVGFWGEWHTWPYNGTEGKPDWMPSPVVQEEVLTAFVNAFDETELEVRNPDAINASMPIGYHDDSFALSTKTSALGWHFMDNMVAVGATEKWRDFSIGGELRPELQPCLFSVVGCPVIEEGGDNDFAGSVEQTHATWMMNHYAFATGYPEPDRSVALAASQSLGYSFRVTEALVPTTTATGGSAEVGVTMANDGVAPFYEDWPVTLAVVDASGTVVTTAATDWLVGDVPSGEERTFTTTLDLSDVPAGEHSLVAQVTNPLAGGMPIRFANAAQDADVDGWLTLGTLAVTDTAAPVVEPVPEATVPSTAPVAPSAAPADAERAAAPAASRSSLAATGSDALPGLVAALAALALGGIALGVRRLRH